MYGTWNSEMQWTFSNVKYPDLPFKHRMRTHILQAMVLLNRCSFKLLLESELFRAFIELSDQRPPPADHCTPTADHDNKRGSWSDESLQSEVKTVAISGAQGKWQLSFLQLRFSIKFRRWWVVLSRLCSLLQVLHHTCRRMVPGGKMVVNASHHEVGSRRPTIYHLVGRVQIRLLTAYGLKTPRSQWLTASRGGSFQKCSSSSCFHLPPWQSGGPRLSTAP